MRLWRGMAVMSLPTGTALLTWYSSPPPLEPGAWSLEPGAGISKQESLSTVSCSCREARHGTTLHGTARQRHGTGPQDVVTQPYWLSLIISQAIRAVRQAAYKSEMHLLRQASQAVSRQSTLLHSSTVHRVKTTEETKSRYSETT